MYLYFLANPFLFYIFWAFGLFSLFIIFYFIFQLVFLKRKVFLSFIASVFSFLLYFYVVFILFQRFPRDIFLRDWYTMLTFNLHGLEELFFVFSFLFVIKKIFKLDPPLNKRTDVYPISLFCPKEATVQKALEKRKEGKTYPALVIFITLIILLTLFYYGLFLQGEFKSPFMSNRMFVLYAVLYFPLLYLVYKGNWIAGIIVYIFWVLNLSLEDRIVIVSFFGKDYFMTKSGVKIYIRPEFEHFSYYLFYYLRFCVMIYAARLLTIICKVEREKNRLKGK